MSFVCLDCPDWEKESLPEDVATLWTSLAIAGGQVDPLCCAADWNLAYHAVRQPGQRVLYMASDNGLIIFTEVFVESIGPILLPVENGWMFGSPLLGADCLELLALAMPRLEKFYYPLFPQIEISGIPWRRYPRDVPLFRTFSDSFDFYGTGQRTTQCAASLEGGLDAWFARRSPKLRANLRSAARKCAKAGVRFERFRPMNGREGRRLFQRMLAIEENSWKGIGHCGMTEEISSAFYQELVCRFSWSRSMFAIIASLDGEDVGFIFGGACGKIYRGQQFSFAEKMRGFSLGNVLQLEMIQWLTELGFRRYDMGPVTGERMGYKKSWAEMYGTILCWRMIKK